MNTISHTPKTVPSASTTATRALRAQLWRSLWHTAQKFTAFAALATLSLATSTAIAQSADLSISAPSVGSIVANNNGSWTIPVTYTVTNNGTISAAAPWYDLAYLSTDATLDNSDTYSGSLGYRSAVLAAGASYTTTVNVSIAPTSAPGSYTLFLKADGRNSSLGGTNTDNGAVAETNETNNVTSTSITLARPDLSLGTPVLGTVVANANGSWTIPVTYTVTNTGTVAVQPSWRDLGYLSADGVLDNNDFSSALHTRGAALAAGASYTVTANFTTATTLSSGTYTLFLKSDGRSPAHNGTNTDNGAIPEPNEANNLRWSGVTLANKAITATTLNSSLNPANKLQPTLLTATVFGNGIPTGSITFRDGSNTLATVSLSGGTASYSASFTTSGNHGLTAVYSGTADNPASTSAVLQQSVSTVSSSSTALTATPNPVVAGQTATLTANITGGSPSGTVTFSDGSTALGTAPVSAGRAIFAATFGTAGTRNLSASYAGDSLNTASTSASLVFTVSATPPGQLPAAPVSLIPIVSYEYDAMGNPTKTVQAPGVAGFGFENKASYDPLQRVKDTTDPKNGLTRFQYDGGNRITQVTDPRNLITSYPRDGLGQATQLVSPDTGTASHTYDAAGNLKTRTDSRGVLATNTYDALNRLTSTVYSQSGQASQTYNWAYDQTGTAFANGIGRLTSTSHPTGSTTYKYDAQGRIAESIQVVNATSGANTLTSHSVIYAYDISGRTSSITYPSGREVRYAYTDGELTGISLVPTATGTPVPLVSQIQWEPFGPVKSWRWHMNSGLQANDKVYDTSGRLVRYRMHNLIRDITYDAAERITAYTHYDAATAAAQPAFDQSFGYDPNGQLTSIITASATWSVGYDANGNRTSVVLNGSTSTYVTPTTSNRLASISNPARTLSYDNAGNTTGDTSGYTATYDLSGRLDTLTKAGVTSRYAYNGQGQRIRKYSSTGAASTLIFVYDQNGQLLGEYNSGGAVLREYVWLGSTPVAVFTPNGAGNPPSVYYIHTDHLDTPRFVTGTSGSLRWRWLAEPFGTTAPETNPAGFGVFTQNLRFPGQYADQESGLNYNYFRDYDSTTGRYVQSDPIGLAGGINTFSYVGSNPLSAVDPLGLFAVAGGGVAGGGVAGGGLGAGGAAGGAGSGSSGGAGSGAGGQDGPGNRDRDRGNQCVIYHIRDCVGNVIYVGKTSRDPRIREREHRFDWRGKIKQYECERCRFSYEVVREYPDASSCDTAERREIRYYRPFANYLLNPDTRAEGYRKYQEWKSEHCIPCQ